MFDEEFSRLTLHLQRVTTRRQECSNPTVSTLHRAAFPSDIALISLLYFIVMMIGVYYLIVSSKTGYSPKYVPSHTSS